MIQRIQTIWLALTSILSALLCSETILNFSDKSGIYYSLEFSGIFRNDAGSHDLAERTILVSVLLVFISVLSLVSLALFKKRKLQERIVMVIIFFSLCLLGMILYYSLHIINTYDAKPVFSFKMFYPLFLVLFSLLSYRGISKDEKLIKSYDRLR